VTPKSDVEVAAGRRRTAARVVIDPSVESVTYSFGFSKNRRPVAHYVKERGEENAAKGYEGEPNGRNGCRIGASS
jgi:hypothetical protein